MLVDAIIFDLGGVLVDWNPRYVFETVFADEDELTFFLSEVCDGAWNVEQDRGRTFEEAIRLKQKDFPEYEEVIPLYFSRWTEMIRGEIKETVAVLNSLYLQRKYRLYALTNWSAQTWPYAWESFEFLRMFEGIVVSGKEGMIKPDQEIFHLLMERYDVSPSQAVFIDDNRSNVQAAAQLGFEALHFEGTEGLIKSLNGIGVDL